MSHTVCVDVSQPLRWPNRCARCGSKQGLQSASLAVGEVLDTRLKLTGAVEFQTRMTNLRYPVCAAHAKGLGLALAAAVQRRGDAIRSTKGGLD